MKEYDVAITIKNINEIEKVVIASTISNALALVDIYMKQEGYNIDEYDITDCSFRRNIDEVLIEVLKEV